MQDEQKQKSNDNENLNNFPEIDLLDGGVDIVEDPDFYRSFADMREEKKDADK